MTGPQDKREPRKYVPPPWEEQPAAPAPEPEAPERPAEARPEAPAHPVAAAPAPETGLSESDQMAVAMAAMTGDASPAPQPAAADNQPLDPETEARMEQMLVNLSVHESVEHGVDTSKYGTILAVGVAFVGMVMTVWAVVVFARTSQAGFAAVTGSCLVGFMGLFMLGAAAWVAVRARKQRGA